jgi:pimeloyl-ACP methyl ester carboxylesterase
MTVNTVRRDDVEITYETFGPEEGEPLLLVMGTGAQMLAWHPDFCAALVESGFQVIRFDNRDSGLSTHFTSSGAPNQLKMWLRPASVAVYRLEDMADGAVAVLDAQGRQSAHVVGISLGGMIAQVIATRHPGRVRTLTSISSTPSARVGRTRLSTLMRFAKVAKKPVTDAESLAQQMIDLQPFTGSPGYPADTAWLRELARQSYERVGYDLAAAQRQTAAIAAAGDRRPDLAALRVPTLVIHGEADQIIRPIAGQETAKAIPGAVLVTYPGMGHDLPRELWPAAIDKIHDQAQRGAPQASRRRDIPQA